MKGLCGLAVAYISLGLMAVAPARAASLVEVPRATWGATGVPSYMQMYIYVPDHVAAKPPIYISCHSCGSTATGQIGNIPMAKAAADSQGFILILPDNQPNNCWDVGSSASLKHDGGGDTQAVAQMIKYVIKQYNADPGRVYIQGGSGGAMLVQAMAAVYPDLIRAGSARAGVPAGCWADGYSSSNQWSNTCAAGSVTKTAQQWGDLVRAMYPGYTGHRPRLQTYQGDADTTISYKNTGEAIKEWTNVLGLSMTPTSMDTGYKPAGSTYMYNRQFWKNTCGQQVYEAWTAPGGTHSMPYEETEMLKFFGLTAASSPDPEMDCTGTGGAGGGAGGSAGTAGAGGASGSAGASGHGGSSAGGTGGAGGRGGSSVSGSAGTVGSGGAGPGTGGSGPGTGGSGPGTGGSGPGTGGSSGPGTGGSSGPGTGGSSGPGTGGSSGPGTGGSSGPGTGGSSGPGTGGSSGPGTGGSSGPGTGGSSGAGTGGNNTSGAAGTTGAGGSGSGKGGTTGTGTGGSDGGGGCAVGGDVTGAASRITPLVLAVGLFILGRRRRQSRR
jgi:acetylxylan esterase